MSGQTRKPDRSHPDERASYVCYARRVAAACDAPPVMQDELERDIHDILEMVALPDGFAEAVDAALAAHEGGRTRRKERASLSSIERRLARLAELYELGDIARADYLRRRETLHHEREGLKDQDEPTFVRQRTALRTLVDDWTEMGPAARRRVLGTIFERVVVGEKGDLELIPREGWKPYVRAAIQTARALPARDFMSGRRDSNPRPQPWQGCALPTEPLPHSFGKSPNTRIIPSSPPPPGREGSTP
jgi:hypothetical protein